MGRVAMCEGMQRTRLSSTLTGPLLGRQGSYLTTGGPEERSGEGKKMYREIGLGQSRAHYFRNLDRLAFNSGMISDVAGFTRGRDAGE